jgi:hypothetical protein
MVRLELPATEDHPITLAEYPGARDAIEWLKGATENAQRTVGELSSEDDSIDFINKSKAPISR